MRQRFKEWRCKRRGHSWVIVDPEWFVAGASGEPVRTTLCRCKRCLDYDQDVGYP